MIDREDFRRRWDAGESIRSLGRAFGVSKETARKLAIDMGLPRRPPREARRGIAPDEADFMRQHWPMGDMSLVEMSAALQACNTTLYRWAAELGLGGKGEEKALELTPGKYRGRRYEDDPRDPPARAHVTIGGGAVYSMTGNAAAMCAGM